MAGVDVAEPFELQQVGEEQEVAIEEEGEEGEQEVPEVG
jgi:hypothetical protein